jgi:hypothetical protein
MLCDLEHAFARHVSTAEDVFEEGKNVVHTFRPAEGDY